MKILDWPESKIDHMTKTLPSLQSVKKFLNYFDNPQDKLPPIIHITGTNGKGSVSAFLKSILEENGYKIHRYTSPHLLNVNERVEICGKPISDKYLKELENECSEMNNKYPMRISYFEGLTIMAFLAFSRIPADVLILEVGMGGTWDATNVVKNPLANIIMPISLDHMEYLGNTIEKIAKEKAGIFKKNSIAIISKQKNGVYKVLSENAKSKNCKILQYDKDWNIEAKNDGFILNCKNEKFNLPKPSLEGEHQYLNAATAIVTLLSQDKLKINKNSLSRAIQNVNWPGRLQNLTSTKLFKKYFDNNSELWLDGGHNEGAAKIISNWITKKNEENNKKTVIISGIMKRKNSLAFLAQLKDKIDFGIAINIHFDEESSKDNIVYLEEMKSLNIDSVAIDNYEDALKFLKNKYNNESIRIIICGSLYLVGEILNSIDS